MRSLYWKRLVCGAALAAVLVGASPAFAKSRKQAAVIGLEPWRGERVLLLLPLQLGEDFNVDRAFGQAILPEAEQTLQMMLQKTGKLSVMQIHRFNPIFQRALVEKRITADQLTTLVASPTLENARGVLDKIAFEQTPLIAQFFVDEVRLGGTAKDTIVQARVSGRLYELGNPAALKNVGFTSDSQRARQGVTPALQLALGDAFRRSAQEFVAPIQEIQLALPDLPAAPAPKAGEPKAGDVKPIAPAANPAGGGATGEVPVVVSPTKPRTEGTSDTPLSGIPQLPATAPPLGINVPGAPVADR